MMHLRSETKTRSLLNFYEYMIAKYYNKFLLKPFFLHSSYFINIIITVLNLIRFPIFNQVKLLAGHFSSSAKISNVNSP